MVRRIKAKLVLQLLYQGLARRTISPPKECPGIASRRCSILRNGSVSAGMTSRMGRRPRCVRCCFPAEASG